MSLHSTTVECTTCDGLGRIKTASGPQDCGGCSGQGFITKAVIDEPKDHTDVVAGFKLLKDAKKYDFAAISGKDHFGNLWDYHTAGEQEIKDGKRTVFTDRNQLSNLVDQLPVAENFTVGAVLMGDDGEPVLDSKGRMVVDETRVMSQFKGVGNTNGVQSFGVHSQKYAIVQYPEMLHPMLEAAQELDLHIAGRMDNKKQGSNISGRAVIGDSDAVIEVLQDSGDFLMMGFRFGASHDGTGAVKLQPFGVRTICCNENIWGQWLPSFSLKHIGNPQTQTSRFATAFQDYLKMVPTIEAKLNEAAESPIATMDLKLAALGAGVPIRHIANWGDEMGKWEPEAKGSGTNLWHGVNSFSAYVTHGLDVAQDSKDRLLTIGERLLIPAAIEGYIEEGATVAEDFRSKRDEQVRTGARKSIPAIDGITTGAVY